MCIQAREGGWNNPNAQKITSVSKGAEKLSPCAGPVGTSNGLSAVETFLWVPEK